MKILNPSYVRPADAAAQVIKTKLATWFAAHPAVESITWEQLAAAIPEASALALGQVHQALKDAGMTVTVDQ